MHITGFIKKASCDQPGELPGYRWAIFVAVVLNGVLMYFHLAWGATLSGYHMAAWHLDAGKLGLLAALGFLTYALMQIPGGYITDLLGVRRVMSAAALATALGTALFAGAATFAVAAVGRILIGLGGAVVLLPSLKILSRWFPSRKFATIQGAYLLISTSGAVAATLPLAWVAERWGWRVPMFAVAALSGIVSIVSWGMLRNDPTDLGLPPVATTVREAARHLGPDRPTLSAGFQAWKASPTFWASSLVFFATIGSMQAFQGLWAGPMLRQIRGLTTTATGQMLLLFTVGLGFGPLLFGLISDHVIRKRKTVVVFCAASETVMWILIIATFGGLPLPLLGASFFAVSTLAGGVLVAQAMITEVCPPSLFGTVFGIVNGWAFYGTAAFQLLIGVILNATGPTMTATEPIYSARAYTLALSPIIGFMLMAVILSVRVGETLIKGRG
jgi:sugar phosphate permease